MATLAPVIVTYCDKCGLPPEYCEYNTEVEHPAPAAASTSSDGVEAKLGQLSVEGGEENRGAAGEAGPSAGEEKKEGEGEAKKPKGGKKQVKKQIVIERAVRNKRKCVTTIRGLDLYGYKLADAAKKFGKKFACGASVVKDATGKEEIDIQGDFMDELIDFLAQEFKEVPADDVKTVDKAAK